MFIQTEKYDKSEPSGMLLPRVNFEKEFFEEKNISPNATSVEILRELCRSGIKEKGIDKLENKQVYYDRIKYEIQTFDELGFTDYALLNYAVWRRFTKDNGMLISDGRGSAASSMIFYLLGVTNVDPIKNNLYFERFVSKSRARKIEGWDGKIYLDGSLAPDCDVDQSMATRNKVLEYLNQQYKNKTAKILTVNTLSSKLVVKECYKYCRDASEEDANYVSDMIEKRFGNADSIDRSCKENIKFSKWAEDNQIVVKTAMKLEDLNKNFGVHPSGVLVSYEDITDIMPIQKNKDGELISGYNMIDSGELAIKLDLLGLRTLSVAELTCQKLGISFYDIDCNHESIYKSFQDFNNPHGLFQISASMNFETAKSIKPVNLGELADVISLARPGAAMFINEYIKIKNGEQAVKKRWKSLDEVLEPTKGVIIYQESLMQIAHKVFGLTLEQAELIRKCTSKKRVEEMKKWESVIFEQAVKLEIPKDVAQFYWDALIASADYSFCKCCDISTLVETEEGSTKMMKDIKIGEKILAFDKDSNKNHYVEVTNIYKSKQLLYEVRLENGKTIKTSLSHKFLTASGEMKELGYIVLDGSDIVCVDDHGKAQTNHILMLKRLEETDTLDFEVNHKDHNFIANGIVVSNSHAVAYSQLAAKTVWLKYNHPKEFFLSLLELSQSEPNPLEEITAISKELPYFGIRLLPPSLEHSQMEFSIDGNDIRFGLKAMKGLSDKTVEPLKKFIDYRAKETNKFDVFLAAQQAKLNIGALAALIQSGALSGYGSSRSKMVLEAQTFNLLTDKEKRQMLNLGAKYNWDLLQMIADTQEKNLCGDDGKIIMTPKRFGTFKKKFDQFRDMYLENKKYEKLCNWWFEYTLLGYVYSSNIQDAFDNKYGRIMTAEEIAKAGENDTIKFAGKVTEIVTKKSKAGNKYMRVSVDDGFVTLNAMMIDNKRQAKYTEFMESGQKVPKKDDIVVLVGNKADGGTIFLEMIHVIPTRVYMKIRELGKKEEAE